MDKKTIIIGIVAIAIIVAALLVFNPFKKPEPVLEDENDPSLAGPLDVLTPEELQAHEEQIESSDPVRFEAVQKKDPNICNQEPKTEDVGWCKAAVAEVLGDESICSALSGFARNQCYNDVARAKNNPELCKSIEDAGYRDDCLSIVAANAGKLELCFEVKNIDKGDNCIALIAWNSQNAETCKQLRDAEFKDDCVREIARATANPQTCAGMSDTGAADYCIKQIAFEQGDTSMCSAIKQATKREDCVLDITGE